MTINDVRGTHAHVAVGPDHLTAAAAFGHSAEDLFLSTYSTLGDEVEFSRIKRLDIVADPVTTDRMASWLSAVSGPVCVVRVALPVGVSPEHTAGLADLLSEAGLGISEVTHTDGFTILVLAPIDRGQDLEGSRRTVALVLAAITGPRPAREAVVPTGAAPRSRPGPGPGKPRRRPQPLRILDAVNRWRRGRRRLAVIIAAAFVAAGLLLLGILAPTQRPLVSIGFPLVILLLLASGAATTYVVLLLARQVHRQTGRLEEMVRRDRHLARRQHDALAKRLDTLREGQERLAFIEDYVQAVAAHSSASNARMQEALQQLARQHRTDADRQPPATP